MELEEELERHVEGSVITSSGSEASEVETIAEAFYHVAHRFLDLCEDAPVLGFRGVRAESVKRVRNHLIEHANKKNGVMARGFIWGIQGGPQLKPFGLGGRRPSQPGLYHHAAELLDSLRRGMEKI
jgi:hypothetical protein